MLKADISHSDSDVSIPVATVVPVTVSLSEYSPESNGLKMNSTLIEFNRIILVHSFTKF